MKVHPNKSVFILLTIISNNFKKMEAIIYAPLLTILNLLSLSIISVCYPVSLELDLEVILSLWEIFPTIQTCLNSDWAKASFQNPTSTFSHKVVWCSGWNNGEIIHYKFILDAEAINTKLYCWGGCVPLCGKNTQYWLTESKVFCRKTMQEFIPLKWPKINSRKSRESNRRHTQHTVRT